MKFLLDEHLPKSHVNAVKQFDPTIDILRVGGPNAPPLGTADPDLLIFCEAEQRALVTDNRSTMPGHEVDHFALGHHHWGVFEVRNGTSFGSLTRELQLLWGASEADEWIDRRVWIPM